MKITYKRTIIVVASFLLVFSAFASFTMDFALAADKETRDDSTIDLLTRCTGMYVGKDASAEGKQIIARSEDQGCGLCNKLFEVVPAEKGENRTIVDEEQQNFSVEIPDETCKYITLRDSKELIEPYYASCINEYGLAVTATVTTEVCDMYSYFDPVKPWGHGLREAILPAIPACQCKSAREGVEILAKYMDKYGSGEYNTILLSDKNEAWIFEMYGGTSYAAMKLPSDKVAVFGNQIMLGWIDFDNLGDDWVVSSNLKKCLDRLPGKVVDDKGRYHLARSIAGNLRYDFSNMRTWRGHDAWAPSKTGGYNTDTFYSLLFTPDEKVSLQDVIKLYGDRYEGTKYDMEKEGNENVRPIGTPRQSCVHIIQTWDELPDCCCQLQWLSVGNAEHCIFVPAFSGITDTFDKYKIHNTYEDAINDSFYYMCRRNAALSESDREHLSRGLKDFNHDQEERMASTIDSSIDEIKAAYDDSREAGDKYVTDMAMKMAEEQYENTKLVYDRLSYIQIYNMSDNGDMRFFKYKKGRCYVAGDDEANTEFSNTETSDKTTIYLILGILALIAIAEAVYIFIRNRKKNN
ncbi:MAG: C69 family dipeptidase [Clostridia bacterium]|nr:C69 family dipeptidase [Clostridia bacterium]